MSITDQNQPINLLGQLQSLSSAVHSLLQSNNPNQQLITFYEINLKNWALNLVFLGLLPQENITEIEQINNPRERLEKLLAILDEYLQTSEELGESVVPQEILEDLVEKSEAAAAQNEELLREIKTKNEARLKQIKRQIRIKEQLGKFIRTAPLDEQQVQEISTAIAQRMQAELTALEGQANKSADNIALREELQKHGQTIYENAVNSLGADQATKEYLCSRKLSAETFIKLTEVKQQNETRQVIFNLLKPISLKEAEILQKEVIVGIAIDVGNLTNVEDVPDVIAINIGEKLPELEESFSQDRLLNLIPDLSRVTQRLVSEDPPVNITFATTPTVTLSDDKIHVSLTAPSTPGNPQGKVIKILVDSNATLGAKIVRDISTGKIDPQEIKTRISTIKLFALTARGFSPEEFERLAAVKAREGTTVSIKQSNELKNLAAQLRFFQQRFPRPLLVKVWQSNRLKAIREISLKVSSIKSVAHQRFNTWIAKTSLGQAFKTLSSKAAQQGLQKLFGLASKEAVKKVAGQTIKSAIVRVIGALGLDAIAGTLTGGLGTVIMLGIQVGWGVVKSTVKFGKKFLIALSLGSIEEKDFQLKKLIIAPFALLILFSLMGMGSLGVSFLGEQGSGTFVPGIVEPINSSLDCDQGPRHFAEKVICIITHEPCNQSKVNKSNISIVDQCLANTGISNELISAFNTSVDNFTNLQCVGFVWGIQAALNRTLLLRENIENACELLKKNIHINYEVLGRYETPQVGDIAVWSGTKCSLLELDMGISQGQVYFSPEGHVSVVIEVKALGMEIITAGANGYTGALEIKPALRGVPGGPDGYLRYKGL